MFHCENHENQNYAHESYQWFLLITFQKINNTSSQVISGHHTSVLLSLHVLAFAHMVTWNITGMRVNENE